MNLHVLVRRHRPAMAALLALSVGLTSVLAVPPAGAAPVETAPVEAAAVEAAAVQGVRAAPGDPEGGSKELRDQLEDASKGFVEARTALQKSQSRQRQLAVHLKQVEAELASRGEALGELADVAYRTGRLAPMTALLNAGSPDGFLDRAAVLGTVAANEDRRLRELVATKQKETRAQLELAGEIREQQRQVALMTRRKQQAERALKAAAVGGEAAAGPSGSSSSAGSSSAQPARRNPDGSLPGESCTANDPTTSGCITPRTLNAMRQAKAAGFTRFVSCFRSGGSGEHPRGRACDFAAQRNGFGGTASGGDRTYGNNLANYFVRNANRLGVLYVIWFRRIWLPSSGWRTYNGGGDPSSDHTNHVHLSML